MCTSVLQEVCECVHACVFGWAGRVYWLKYYTLLLQAAQTELEWASLIKLIKYVNDLKLKT